MNEKVAATARELRVKQWREEQQDQQKSGLSVAAYCRREGVAESTFYQRATRLGSAKREAHGLGTKPVAQPVAQERARFIDAGPLVIAAPEEHAVRTQREATQEQAAGVEVRLELGGGLVLYVRRT
jgi:hypothetical protein